MIKKFINFSFMKKKQLLQKPPKSHSEWFNRIRANQITGKISSADILKAKAEIEKNKKSSNEEFNFNWVDRGPDNAGGRTRALLIDNQNPNFLYAGCVSGGLWTYTESESTNPEDHTWTKVEIESNEILSVSCITQTDDGTIYFGTGEGFTDSKGIGEGGFPGCGIWKGTSNDGFQRLESTWDTDVNKETFMFVNEITADPKDNSKIYASTNKGLMFTSDGGTTWANVLPEDNEDAFGISHDVAVSFDGSSSFVIASINKKVYLKKDGGSFELISIKDAVDGDGTISHKKSIGRIEFALTNLDVNYIYCSLSSTEGDLEKIYKSTDKGETWEIIGLENILIFAPFEGNTGNYSHCLAVRPDNKNLVMIGGTNIFMREEVGEWSLFAFLANNNQHSIVFPDNYNADEPYHFYIATDGGVIRGNSSGLFVPLGYNYNSTMSYSVAYNKTGKELLTGTEAKGTRLIRETQTPNYSFELSSGSSGDCEYSMLADDFYFRTNVNGEVYRYNANKDINDLVSDDDDEWTSTYVTPIALWESPNDEKSMDSIIYKIKDTSKNIGDILYYAGDSVFLKSQIGGHNLMYKFEEDFIKTDDENEEDSIFIQDVCQSMFAVGLKNKVMLTFDPLNSNPIYKWFDILPKIDKNEVDAYVVEALEFSKDGDILYVATYNSKTYRGYLWRLSNLLDSRNDSLMDSDSSAFSVERQIIANFYDRVRRKFYFKTRRFTKNACL
ncbi:MAG: hypothetical protein B6I24_05815 [Bacteroidetes bacterium 4572_128]|nr:MAG: hypothetical protein B6I24_05815 [Bacteroidetes bacterium 4572_128]